jgi:hypothetical protein
MCLIQNLVIIKLVSLFTSEICILSVLYSLFKSSKFAGNLWPDLKIIFWCNNTTYMYILVSLQPKKPKNRLNRENQKKITEKTEPWKKNQLKFWKNRPVRFWFISLKLKKPSKIEKTKSNRFEPVFVQKNQIEPKPVGLNRF